MLIHLLGQVYKEGEASKVTVNNIVKSKLCNRNKEKAVYFIGNSTSFIWNVELPISHNEI